ncbi:head-tail connector protein [Alkalicoccobacillus gibsonii]|uniref:head-tail connector protein n=1 Tax=Alkalicoccobacillus gibsonii TaxID=79881 RepID=UPI003F7BADD6
MNDLLNRVKTSLRISQENKAFDGDVQDLIEAAQADLFQSGVSAEKSISETDPLIRRAVITYSKAHFGIDNPDADRFAKSYDLLKQHLTMAGDYNGRAVE